jgi:hypothetical protein
MAKRLLASLEGLWLVELNDHDVTLEVINNVSSLIGLDPGWGVTTPPYQPCKSYDTTKREPGA